MVIEFNGCPFILTLKGGIPSVSLHSCRYAWAERARVPVGYASEVIHRAYAKSVRVELPPLEEYERDKPKVIAPPRGPVALARSGWRIFRM